MRRNPEFQRNLWLEITPHRLIATPLIFGGFYYLILYFGDHGDRTLLVTSLWVFVLFAGLWGSHQSENALVSEVQNKTWPLQRLTSINPWTMTWGKLFGSTLFSWYTGFWSLLVFVLTLLLAPDISLFPYPDRKWVLLSHGVVPAILFTVGVTLWFQAWGLLMGLYQLQNKESKSKRKSGASLLLGIFLLPTLISISFMPANAADGLHWYQWEFNQFWFGLVSVYLFLGWVMTGIYMQMRRELQVANPPWVWMAFMIFIVGYAMGFVEGKESWSSDGMKLWGFRMFCGWVLMVGLTYFILWWERADGVDIRRLLHLWDARRLRDALCEVPRWLVGLILAWGSAVTVMIILLGFSGAELFKENVVNPFGFIIAMMFFLMRDIALLLYFYFSDKPQRALATAMVYWVVLYLLIPLLLGVVWMDALSPLFLPNDSVHIAYAILPPLIQAALMWTFTIRRWRTRFGSPAV